MTTTKTIPEANKAGWEVHVAKEDAKTLLQLFAKGRCNDNNDMVIDAPEGWSAERADLARDVLLQALDGPEGRNIYNDVNPVKATAISFIGHPPATPQEVREIAEIMHDMERGATYLSNLKLKEIYLGTMKKDPDKINLAAWQKAVENVQQLSSETERALREVGIRVQPESTGRQQ